MPASSPRRAYQRRCQGPLIHFPAQGRAHVRLYPRAPRRQPSGAPGHTHRILYRRFCHGQLGAAGAVGQDSRRARRRRPGAVTAGAGLRLDRGHATGRLPDHTAGLQAGDPRLGPAH
nr:hypothetical protein [Tanacetum cinerariifolium]